MESRLINVLMFIAIIQNRSYNLINHYYPVIITQINDKHFHIWLHTAQLVSVLQFTHWVIFAMCVYIFQSLSRNVNLITKHFGLKYLHMVKSNVGTSQQKINKLPKYKCYKSWPQKNLEIGLTSFRPNVQFG